MRPNERGMACSAIIICHDDQRHAATILERRYALWFMLALGRLPLIDLHGLFVQMLQQFAYLLKQYVWCSTGCLRLRRLIQAEKMLTQLTLVYVS